MIERFYMKVIRVMLLGTLITAATISSAAFAEDTGAYAGLNVGIGKPDINTPNGEDKKSSAVGGAVLGYKFNQYMAIEGQYTGAGKVTDNVKGSAKVDAASLAMIGFLPLNDQFNLYGKLGVASTKTTVTSSLSPINDATHTGVTYGLGAEYNVNHNVGLRLGWDHYNAAIKEVGNHERDVNANVMTVGAVYHF